MSREKILISQIKNVANIKSHHLKGIESSKQKIFGYAKNLPGEKNWIKPLVGKSLQNYYFPSKYLHLDFNLQEYLRMQTVRFKKKEIDSSLLKLQECINLLIENKEVIDHFLSKLSKKVLLENQSLKDLCSLYFTVFSSEKQNCSLSWNEQDLGMQNGNFHWFKEGRDRRISTLRTQQKADIDDSSVCTYEGISESKKKEDYKNIIFTKTDRFVAFKNIVCTEKFVEKKEDTEKDQIMKHSNDPSEDKFFYLHYNVHLGLEKPIDETKKREEEEEKERTKQFFYKAIEENDSLKQTLSVRNRFVDPLYLRRRYSFIDKLTKKKIKKEKHKTYRMHFIQSADEKKIWPDNKGLLNKKYPNPYS